MSERKPNAFGLTGRMREVRKLPDDGISGVPLKPRPSRSPSKPLTPTELDELRRDLDREPAGYVTGSPLIWITRLLATLDATQAVEPGLRERVRQAASAIGLDDIKANGGMSMTDSLLIAFAAARSSSAPAELGLPEAAQAVLDAELSFADKGFGPTVSARELSRYDKAMKRLRRALAKEPSDG